MLETISQDADAAAGRPAETMQLVLCSPDTPFPVPAEARWVLQLRVPQ